MGSMIAQELKDQSREHRWVKDWVQKLCESHLLKCDRHLPIGASPFKGDIIQSKFDGMQLS